jgi:hypothetical protein
VAADRFLGYLRAQRAAMTGEVGAHPDRPELVAAHGFDVRFAMHALRLGLQGVELLPTVRITLPVPVRLGAVPLAEVVAAVEDAEARLLALRDSPAVPPAPDSAWVDGWLPRSYLAHRETR